MLTLRPYQVEAVESIFTYFATNYGNPLVGLPTGTGKSVVIADFIKKAIERYPGTRMLCMTHVKELIDQNHKKLVEHWPQAPAGVYSAGLKRRDIHYPVTFCGIASVHKKMDHFGFIHMVLVDEAHLISDKGSSMYAKALDELRKVNPLLKVVGFTASPFRLGMGLLTDGQLFTDFCINYCEMEKFNFLVDQGYICPLVPKKTELELSVDNVGLTSGEFNMDELQAAVDKVSITRGAVEEAVKIAHDRWHWLVFCTGTSHADHTAELLNQYGVSALVVHSKMEGFGAGVIPLPGEEPRDAHIRYFKSGLVRAIVNVGILTTGFDYPAIDHIMVLRPTMSPGLWVQLLGRGTRPCWLTWKVNCLVTDFAANTRRLGPINDPVLPRKKGTKGSAFVPFKVCPVCSTYCHTRVRFCPVCQYAFPEHFAASTQASTDELIRKEKPAKAVEIKPEAVVEEYVVNRVEWAKHHSRDETKPPSLRVSYYCGTRVFNEWLCFEHPVGSFPWRKARDAWGLMNGGETPLSIDQALAEVETLAPPSRIRVLHQGKWPEIAGYSFDGAAPLSLVEGSEDLPF